MTDDNARFFQVRQLDDQPPAIVAQYPQDGGFAVPRFSNLTLQLSDVTGLDTNSIRLTVGSLGTFTLANTNLPWTNGLLTFINGGSIALGAWGSNVQATMIAADTFGNAGTKTTATPAFALSSCIRGTKTSGNPMVRARISSSA